MAEVTLVEAVNLALGRAMEDDPDVVVLGEDVGVSGGVFRATLGLQKRFGADRVLDTPLAELLISGICVGMAAQGLKPVGEIQFMGFMYPCLDQLVNHASRIRNRTQGRLTCPMVLRTPHGAGIRAPEHHSESTEAMLAHIPGLRVVIPSSPERAYGLLLAAVRDPDPVVFLEPTRLYRAAKGEVQDNGEALPLDRAFVLRQGRDITLIGWGAVLREITAAADLLSAEGIGAEIIDLARSSLMMKEPCSARSQRPDVASSCTRRPGPADSGPRSRPLSPNVACPRCSRLSPASPAMTPSSRWHAWSNTTCRRSNASSARHARRASSTKPQRTLSHAPVHAAGSRRGP